MRRASLFILAAALSPVGVVSAGKVSTVYVNIDEGNVVALLEESSQYHVDAMRRLIADRYPGTYEARRWEIIETHLREATIARIEYEYTLNGRPQIHTYHAIAGEPLGQVAHEALEGPTPLPSPSSPGISDAEDAYTGLPDGNASERPAVTDEELVTLEAADDVYYPAFHQPDMRAPFRPGGRSVMQPYHHEGTYHGFDAEYKSLRALEEDILKGAVPRGGLVRGMLSGTTCSSCRYAVERFARTYDLDIRFSELSPSIPSRVRKELIQSGRARLKGLKLVDAASGRPMIAFDALATVRDAQVRENLSPRAMQRAKNGGASQRRSFRLSQPPRSRVTDNSHASPDASTTEATTEAAGVPKDC